MKLTHSIYSSICAHCISVAKEAKDKSVQWTACLLCRQSLNQHLTPSLPPIVFAYFWHRVGFGDVIWHPFILAHSHDTSFTCGHDKCLVETVFYCKVLTRKNSSVGAFCGVCPRARVCVHMMFTHLHVHVCARALYVCTRPCDYLNMSVRVHCLGICACSQLCLHMCALGCSYMRV